MINQLIKFNVTALSVGRPVKISGMRPDHWYFEHNGIVKEISPNRIIVTYHDRFTKQPVEFLVSIEDLLKGRTSLERL